MSELTKLRAIVANLCPHTVIECAIECKCLPDVTDLTCDDDVSVASAIVVLEKAYRQWNFDYDKAVGPLIKKSTWDS